MIDRLTATEVNLRTGFADICNLLFFISIICNGDLDKCMQQTSYMCWLEEWFFFFEMMYGHMANRWIDYEWLYQISKLVLCRIFKQKLEMILTARSAWPLYATQDEDRMRKEIWDHYFKQADIENVPCLVMHDNTNVPLMRPSDPRLQRALYSRYYGRCIAKGGVAVQPCGWITTWELCTGGIDDSRYVKMVKVFEKQQQYAHYDETDQWPFTNIFDRGYRVVLDGIKCGNQICIQPAFTDNEKNSQQIKSYTQQQ